MHNFDKSLTYKTLTIKKYSVNIIFSKIKRLTSTSFLINILIFKSSSAFHYFLVHVSLMLNIKVIFKEIN